MVETSQKIGVPVSLAARVRATRLLFAGAIALFLALGSNLDARAQDASTSLPTATPQPVSTPQAPAAPASDTGSIPLTATTSITGESSITATFATTGVVDAVAGEPLRASRVTGLLEAQYAVDYLGLQSVIIDQPVTLNLTFDTQDPQLKGLVNYLVLTQDGMRRFLAGEDPAELDIAAGGPVPNDPAFNRLTGTFLDSGRGEYTVLVYNESTTPISYTLEAVNGVLLDVAGQVAVNRGDIAPAPTPLPTPIPYGPVVVTGRRLSGTLDGQYQRHYLSLAPEIVDGLVQLTMQYEPANLPELAGDINFWVLDQAGINALIHGDNPGEINVATGFPSPFANLGDLLAAFRASGGNEYTAVMYNTSGVPASYAINADGALLVDRYGQTNEATAALAEVAALSVTPTPTPTPAPAVLDVSQPELQSMPPIGVRGSLDSPYEQHFLGLFPDVRDGQVTVMLDYDPKDVEALRGHINFWVLDSDGLRRVVAGGRPQDYSLASGAPIPSGPDEGKLRGSFTVSGRDEYTLIVHNDTEVPASYTVQAAGATIRDTLGQTTPVP